MRTLRERVTNFQIAPKYGIQIGEDNADLLIGMISDELREGFEWKASEVARKEAEWRDTEAPSLDDLIPRSMAAMREK